MQNYLDKYRGNVNKQNSDFEEKGSKKKKKSKQTILDPSQFEDSEYLPIIVNAEEERKLEAERKRNELLNSKKSEIDAGWKIVKDETVEISTKKQRHDSPEPEVIPRRKRMDSPEPQKNTFVGESKPKEDLSPPRRKVEEKDLSPPRRRRTTPSPDRNEDLSPPRRNRDLSPPRRRRASPSPSPEKTKDLSPPRRSNDGDLSPPRKRQRSPSPSHSRGVSPQKEKIISGLQHPQQLKAKLDTDREKEQKDIHLLPYDVTGQFAETIFRDREGKIISREEFIDMKRKEREKKQTIIKKDFEWGKGLVQKQEQMNEEEAIMNEMSKPFARYEGEDEELEEELKTIIREGDPMAKFLKKDKKKHKKKEKNFSMNRYGIPPGKKWDGFDRSNGFEKKLLQTQNQREIEKRKGYQDL